MPSVNGMEWQGTLEDVYYTPGVHVRFLSLGKLESQGWVIRLRKDGMLLRDRGGDVNDIDKVNNVYPTEPRIVPTRKVLAVWMGDYREMTVPELVQYLQKVMTKATARGNGAKVTLMTWRTTAGTSVVQDSGSVSEERHKWDSHQQLTCEDTQSQCMCCVRSGQSVGGGVGGRCWGEVLGGRICTHRADIIEHCRRFSLSLRHYC